MIVEGLIAWMTMEGLKQPSVEPSYPAGLRDRGNAIFRYALPSTDSPNLIIVDPIYDSERNIIPPGYYQLVLADDRDFLLLVQSGKILAVVPVFKLEEDKEEVAKIYDKKYQKALAKEKKKKEKKNKKLIKKGLPPEKDEVYMEATIEYQKDGGYYLVTYERGRIKAWGMIKG